MPAGLTPWQTAVISALAALACGLALLLLGVVVDELREARKERDETRVILRKHMDDRHAHGTARSIYPPRYRPP